MIDNDDFVGLQIVGIQNRIYDIGAESILVLMSAPLVSPIARFQTNEKLLRDHVSILSLCPKHIFDNVFAILRS